MEQNGSVALERFNKESLLTPIEGGEISFWRLKLTLGIRLIAAPQSPLVHFFSDVNASIPTPRTADTSLDS